MMNSHFFENEIRDAFTSYVKKVGCLGQPDAYYADIVIDDIEYRLCLRLDSGAWRSHVFSATINDANTDEDPTVVPDKFGSCNPYEILSGAIRELASFALDRREQETTTPNHSEVPALPLITRDELDALVGQVWQGGDHRVMPHPELEHTFLVTVQMYELVSFSFRRSHGIIGPWEATLLGTDEDWGTYGFDSTTPAREVLEAFRQALLNR